MYRLNGVSLNDVTVWKNVDFKFEEGITDIRGGNRVGKSLLFSSLPAALYGVPLPKRGLATLDFNTDDKHVVITAKSNGKNNHYDISVDGRDQKVETIADGRAVIDRLLSIPDSLFYTTVHVSGLNKHPLAEAKPSARLEWIQQVLADSQIYDGYAAIVASRMANLKSDTGKAELLKTQISSIEKPTAPKGMDAAKYTDLMDEMMDMKPIIKELTEHVEHLKQRETIGELVEFDQEAYAELKARVAILDETRELWKAHQATEKQRAKAKKLKADIAVHCVFLNAPIVHPRKLLPQITAKLNKSQSRIAKLRGNLALYVEQSEYRNDRSIKVKLTYSSINEATEAIDTLNDERRDLVRHAKLFKEGKGECPTCGQPIKKPKNSDGDTSKIDDKIADAKLQIRKLRAKKIEFVEDPSEDIEKLEERIKVLSDLERACETYLELDLDDTGEVEYDELKHKQLRAKLDGMGEARAEYRLQQKMLEALPDKIAKATSVAKTLKVKQKTLSELNSRLLEISDKVSEWEIYKKLLKQYKNQKEQFDTNLAELGDIDKKNRVLKAMKAAFSRDGLLAMRLDKLVTTFVDQLNVCAPLIWNEPFKFEIDIGPRRCDVIATRNNKPGSIATFSGSEQRGWQLVSALALLRILPNNKRFDTIILDELEANMDDNSQRQFVQDYLPELLKIVPKVVVITPLSRKKLDISTDRSFDVIKKKSYSTLENA